MFTSALVFSIKIEDYRFLTARTSVFQSVIPSHESKIIQCKYRIKIVECRIGMKDWY